MEQAAAILKELPTIFNQVLGILNTFVEMILTVCLAFGVLAGPSAEEPITLVDEENVKLSAVVFADTHLAPTGISPYRFDCGLEDIRNSGIDFDAFVIAGDISELGDDISYELMWEALDKVETENILLATGNHDIRVLYEMRTEQIMKKTAGYLDMEIDKPYYSYDINGYTFIVMGSDEQQFEKAVISDEQLAFLDSELARATADGKPAFVVCHQPLDNTHGLPEVWKNGGLGEDSQKVRNVLVKYENVFYLNGHLHDGVYENSLVALDEEKGVYSINLPAYGKENDYGKFLQPGLGTYMEVYENEVVFTARDFLQGQYLDGYTMTFTLK
ncbi:MAG: metallophosphoesterase [Clostridia bacterium]|nr:metallophosphoesterase [Clostridia bacterium]